MAVAQPAMAYKNAKRRSTQFESSLKGQRATLLRGKKQADSQRAEIKELQEKVHESSGQKDEGLSALRRDPENTLSVEAKTFKHRLEKAEAKAATLKSKLKAELAARDARINRVKTRL